MKTKILALILALSQCITLMPSVLAENSDTEAELTAADLESLNLDEDFLDNVFVDAIEVLQSPEGEIETNGDEVSITLDEEKPIDGIVVDSDATEEETAQITPVPSDDEAAEVSDEVEIMAAGTYFEEYGLYFNESNGRITDADDSISGHFEIPETINDITVTGIETNAFKDCADLTSLDIPETVTYLGQEIIAGTAIETFTVPASVTNSYYYNNKGVLANCETLKTVIFADGATVVPAGICASNSFTSYVEEVVIPETVTEIKADAFWNCDSLTKINIPKSVAYIRGSAFKDCSNLETVTFNYNDEREFTVTLDSYIFSNCEKLKSLDLPQNTVHLGQEIIAGTAIETFTVPASVTNTYYYNNKGVLANCETLKTVIFADGATVVPAGICASNSFTSYVEEVVIPETVTEIKADAFWNCDSLTKINIPKSVAYIRGSAFKDCSNLETVTFNYNDEREFTVTLDSYIFSNCEKLKSLDLPQNTVHLGQEIIAGTAIETFTVPASVTNTYYYNNKGVLANCETLKTVIFADGATVVPAGICASNSFTSYVEEVVIPETVTEIKANAFYNCNILKSIELPQNLCYIGTSAFANCEVLTSVNIPATVSKLDGSAFANCTALSSVTFNDNYSSGAVLEIYNSAFAGCTSLKTLDLPVQTIRLGKGFIKDTRISEITVPKSLKYADYPFAGAIYLDNVYFQSGIKSIPANMCSPGSYTSYLCHVEIPSTVTSIGNNAFKGCDLDKLVIYCYPYSYAHNYAIENGIPYELLEYSNIINNSSWTYASGGSGGGGRIPAADSSATNNSLGITQKNLKPITTGSDTLRGPKFTILGKSFHLFELPINMSIKTPLYSVKYNHKEDHFELLLGTLDKTALTNLGGSAEVYHNVKEFVNTTGIGNVKKMPKIMNYMKSQKMDFGFDFNATPAGYMEFDKSLNFKSGSIVYMLSLDVSMKTPFPPAPVIYLKVGFEADATGKLGIKKVETNAYSLFGSVDIGIGPYVGIGAGSSSIANIEAGAKLKLNAKTDIEIGKSLKNSLTADISGSIYLKIKALMFVNFDDEWDLAKVSLYPDFGANLMSIQSVDEMSVMPRDYAKTESEFTANDNVSAMGIDSIDTSTFVTNVFPYAEPQLIKLNDGRELMVWLEDDTSRSSINRTVLKYSVNDGEWSEPESVHDIATADFSPKLAATENGAFLVWQKTNTVMSDDATFEDMAKNTDIYFSEFAGTTWSEPEQVTYDNDTYEFGIDIASDGANATVVWLENSDNDCFALTGTNTVKTLTYTDGFWDMDSNTVASELGTVSNLGVCYFDERPAVAYILDTDNNVETSGDTELYEYVDGNLSKITDDEVIDYSISMNNDSYIWIHGDQIWERTASGIEQLELPVNPLMLNNAKLLSNGYDRVVVWEQAEDYATELYAIYYDSDDEAWGEPVKLTNDGKKIRESSGYLADDGNIRLAFGQAEIDENNDYGQCNLMISDITEYTDIIVNSTECEFDSYEKGGSAKIITNITNNGSSTISAFYVTVKSGDDEIAKESVSQKVASGETADIEIPFTLPDDLSNKTYTVTISPNDYDIDENNNSATFELGLADLELTTVSYDGEAVSATISNIGYLNAETTVCHLISASGDLLESKEIGTINARKRSTVQFTSTEAADATVYVTSDNDELMYTNNTETVTSNLNSTATGTHVEFVSCDVQQKVLSATATVVNYDADPKTVDVIAVAYKDGVLQKVISKEITVTNGTPMEVPYTFGVYDADTVKIFAWDSIEKGVPNGTAKQVTISYETEE